MTLAEIWADQPRVITQVAKRPGGPYVSLAHKNWEQAIDHARAVQTISTEDLMADDWVKADAP